MFSYSKFGLLGYLFVLLPVSSFSVPFSGISAGYRCDSVPLSSIFRLMVTVSVVSFLLLLFGTRLPVFLAAGRCEFCLVSWLFRGYYWVFVWVNSMSLSPFS